MFETIHHFQQLSSCVGTNSCGVGAPTLFGATAITATNVNENWLADSVQGTTSMAMTGSDQGAYNSYAAISAYWSDTTGKSLYYCIHIRLYLGSLSVCLRAYEILVF